MFKWVTGAFFIGSTAFGAVSYDTDNTLEKIAHEAAITNEKLEKMNKAIEKLNKTLEKVFNELRTKTYDSHGNEVERDYGFPS